MPRRIGIKRIGSLVNILIILNLIIAIWSHFKIENYQFELNRMLITLFSSLVFIIVAVAINRKNEKRFLKILVGFSLIIYMLWSVYGEILSINNYGIFLEWGYLIGTSIGIYKICNEVFSRYVATISSTLFVIFIPNIMGSSNINNQHLSGFLITVSLYFFLKNTLKDSIFGGGVLALSQIIKPISIIILLAVVIFIGYKALLEKSYRENLKILGVWMVTFIVGIKLFNMVFIQVNIETKKVSVSSGESVLALGSMRDKSNTTPAENPKKTQLHSALEFLGLDYNIYNEKTSQAISESIKNPREGFKSLKDKIEKFYGEEDNQYTYSISEEKVTEGIENIVQIGNIQYLIILLSALGAIILRVKRGKTERAIFSIILLCFIWAYTFIEDQGTFRYNIYIFLVILSGEFISRFMQRTKALL